MRVEVGRFRAGDEASFAAAPAEMFPEWTIHDLIYERKLKPYFDKMRAKCGEKAVATFLTKRRAI